MLVGALAFSVLAEMLELHFIIGAFMAGLFFVRKTIDESAYDAVIEKTSAMTYGFLAPIFFASVGLHLDLSALFIVPVFVLSLWRKVGLIKAPRQFMSSCLRSIDDFIF